MYYYDKGKDVIITKSQMIQTYNISLSKSSSLPDDGLVKALGLVPVKQSDNIPEINEFQELDPNGEITYVDGDDFAIQHWAVNEKFIDDTDENGNVTKTRQQKLEEYNTEQEELAQAEAERKAQEEQRLQEEAQAALLVEMRSKRDFALALSDRYALPDYPHESDEIKTAWLTYRQKLRDLPTSENWPNLTENDWPVQPS